MTTVVIEHVALNDLLAAWRNRLPVTAAARVTVRIEEKECHQASYMDKRSFISALLQPSLSGASFACSKSSNAAVT